MPFLAIGKSSEFKPMALQDSGGCVDIIGAHGCQALRDAAKLIFPQGVWKLALLFYTKVYVMVYVVVN